MLLIATSVLIFLTGTALGSFFNVCIHRMPLEESVVFPGSHCPKCKKNIHWYDNIPMLSYLLLQGRCRFCRERISVRYLIIEAVTGAVLLMLWMLNGWTLQFFIGFLLFSFFLIATVVDFDCQIIPDEISVGGLVAGLILSGIFPAIHLKSVWWQGLLASFFGALTGGGIIYLTGVLGDIIFKKESMGGGDVKLLAMIGSFVGWQSVLLVYILAPILALPFGFFLKFVRKQDVLPFGPFLSLAGWIAFWWGNPIIAWYIHGMGF